MGLTLYHYVHCPFCVRVRMALGFLGLKYDSVVLSYDDELTPIKLTGKKMLPALTTDNNTINESLDIIDLIDSENKLNVASTINDASFVQFNNFISEFSTPLHSLVMPYWVFTPEFNEKSRSYFMQKKEAKRGPFSVLVQNQNIYLSKLEPFLIKIEKDLAPFYQSPIFRIHDLLLASHLWGLYILPEFQFSAKLHDYLQIIKSSCHFNYHQDFWR